MSEERPAVAMIQSDPELLARMAEGNQGAAATFVERHVPRLYQALRSFGFDPGESKAVGEFAVQYLLDIARTRAIANDDLDAVLYAIAREYVRRTRKEQQVDAGVLVRTLEHLPPGERQVVERMLRGRTRTDVAADLGVATTEVRAAIQSATARLQEANERAGTPLPDLDAQLKQLVEAARGGDRGAFETLVQHTTPLVRRSVASLVRPEHVDDVVQEVYLKLYEHLDRYRAQAESRFQAWLAVVARRTALDFLRRERRALQTLSLDSTAGQAAMEEAIDTGALLDRDVLGSIRDILTQLSERERQMVILHYLAGRSYADIAETAGISPDTVRTLLARARSKIRKAVEE